MSRTMIVILAVVAVIIFSAATCFSQETMATEDSAFKALQKDAQKIKESNERIEQKVEGLKGDLQKAEKNLGQKIEDSKTGIKEELDQLKKSDKAAVDSLRETRQSLEKKIDKSSAEVKDSLSRMEKILNGIRSNLKAAFYLAAGLIILFLLVCGVARFLKSRPKNIPMKINEVVVDGVKRTYEILVKCHKGVYTSPFKTASGRPITNDDRHDMQSSLRNCLAKSGNGGMFKEQRETLMKGGRIKEIS